jgi:ABC-2 type transport system permease protein
MSEKRLMNRSIFKHEWRIRRRSVLTWSLSLVALFLVFFSFFPTFADQAEIMNQMMASFPPELITAFGMDQTDFSTVLGYFSFMLLFVQLCLAIQAANEGVGLVSVEETELTADFLLTRPITRSQVLTSKLLAAAAGLLFTALVVTVSAYGSIALFRDGRPYDSGRLALLMLSLPLFQFFFLSLGLLISLLVKRVRSTTPYALGMAFGAYVLNAFGGGLGDVKLELITPFKHFEPNFIIREGQLDTPLVLINLAVATLALMFSYFRYLRRDIPAVS